MSSPPPALKSARRRLRDLVVVHALPKRSATSVFSFLFVSAVDALLLVVVVVFVFRGVDASLGSLS